MKQAVFRRKLDLDKEEIKQAFVEDGLTIDCVEIRIVQNGAGSPIEYLGSGSIEVGAKKGVVVRLVCSHAGTDSSNPYGILMAASGPEAGVILPEHHYYRLEARDVAGDIWSCESGDLERSACDSSVVLSFSSDRIRCERSSESKAFYALLVFLDDLGFPKNANQTTTIERSGELWSTQSAWDLSEGEIDGLSITFDGIGKRSDRTYSELVARGKNGSAAPERFEHRLLESVRFCTATMATPVMRQVDTCERLIVEFARARDLNKGMIEPPISLRTRSGDFYRLLDCYYRYTETYAKGDRYSPLSANIGGLFALKGVWIETVVLLLCVSVERLLNEGIFKHLGRPGEDTQSEVVKVVEGLQSLDISETMRTRVARALEGFNSNSAADRLQALINAGVLEEADRKMWKKYRNSSAHGSFQISTDEHQVVVDVVFRLLTMIYKMVFVCIGYSGFYTNFAVRGWPTHSFDLQTFRTALEKNSI